MLLAGGHLFCPAMDLAGNICSAARTWKGSFKTAESFSIAQNANAGRGRARADNRHASKCVATRVYNADHMTKSQGEADPSDKAVSDQICDFDVTEVGRHLSGRPRKQTGWVEKTDSGKKWCGYYYVYEEAPDRTEKRRQRSRVLGACKKMTKTEAEDELARLIGEELHIRRKLVKFRPCSNSGASFTMTVLPAGRKQNR